MAFRAVRGAVTVENNNQEEILNATKELLGKIVEDNNINIDDIASIIFSVTQDLDAVFPAVAARQMGWTDIALMCTNEIYVKGSLEKCIRVMMHINTEKGNRDIKHIYLKGARILRPDLNNKEST